jgi:hypothetical protein
MVHGAFMVRWLGISKSIGPELLALESVPEPETQWQFSFQFGAEIC